MYFQYFQPRYYPAANHPGVRPVMGATIRESCHIMPFNLCLSAAQCRLTRYPYHITADEVSSSEAIIDPPISLMGCLVLTASCIHMMSYANAMSRCALPWLIGGRGHFQIQTYNYCQLDWFKWTWTCWPHRCVHCFLQTVVNLNSSWSPQRFTWDLIGSG